MLLTRLLIHVLSPPERQALRAGRRHHGRVARPSDMGELTDARGRRLRQPLDGPDLSSRPAAGRLPLLVNQVHAFFCSRIPAQMLAIAAPLSTPWLPAGYEQELRRAA